MAYDNSIPRLPDPTTVPTGPGWSTQSLLDNVPVQSNDLNGGSTVAVYQGGNYWNISLTYNSMLPEVYKNLGVFLNSLRGPASPFYLSLPGKSNPSSGQWIIGAGETVGEGNITKVSADTIRVGQKSLLGGTLEVGDYLKLSINDRIYQITSVNEQATYVEYTFHCLIDGTVNTNTFLEPNDILFKCIIPGEKPRESVNTSGLVEGFTLNLKGTVI